MYAPSFVQSAPHQPKKSYVNNPLKTSEISKLLKSKKILKRQATLFFSRFSLKQHIAPKNWWSQTGSNRRPPACKAGALPAELWPPDLSFFRLGPFPFVSGRLHTRFYAPSLRKNEKVLDEKNPASAFLSGYYLAGRKYPSSRSFQPKPRAIFRESRRRLATFGLPNERGFNAESWKMVGLGRFELPTSPLSGVRSNQLSYRP